VTLANIHGGRISAKFAVAGTILFAAGAIWIERDWNRQQALFQEQLPGWIINYGPPLLIGRLLLIAGLLLLVCSIATALYALFSTVFVKR